MDGIAFLLTLDELMLFSSTHYANLKRALVLIDEELFPSDGINSPMIVATHSIIQ
jgi:hypothetical protein